MSPVSESERVHLEAHRRGSLDWSEGELNGQVSVGPGDQCGRNSVSIRTCFPFVFKFPPLRTSLHQFVKVFSWISFQSERTAFVMLTGLAPHRAEGSNASYTQGSVASDERFSYRLVICPCCKPFFQSS